MPPRIDIPVAELVQLIHTYTGNVSAIARAKGCDRHTIQARIDESATAKRALADARETFVDNVESALYKSALAGDTTAAIFVLKAHPAAKARGWGERQEITGKDGKNINIRVSGSITPDERAQALKELDEWNEQRTRA